MCKSGTATTTSEDKKESVESNNYGLPNLSSSSMATMDLGEILIMVLLSVGETRIHEIVTSPGT